MSSDRERIVYDPDTTMGYKWRARVVETCRRDKVRYRGALDRHFMGWIQLDRSRRFRTATEAERWGNARLDAIENKPSGRVVGVVDE